MCRYGFSTYKPHFVCFSCRKAFKQTNPSDILKRVGKLQLYNKLQRKDVRAFNADEELFYKTVKQDYFNRTVKCPECNQLMADLGLDFKAPPKSAIKQWRIIEGLYTTGHSFYSCGCNGPGFIPKDNTQYRDYLLEKLNEYKACLKKAHNTFDRRFAKSERTKYWSENIKLVENEMLKMNMVAE